MVVFDLDCIAVTGLTGLLDWIDGLVAAMDWNNQFVGWPVLDCINWIGLDWIDRIGMDRMDYWTG